MTMYNNPNDPNRERVTETSGTDLRTGDVRRTDVDDRGGSFWPWVIGLLVLLAVGWIAIEAFDRDDDGINDAVPAAGTIEDADRPLDRDTDPAVTVPETGDRVVDDNTTVDNMTLPSGDE